MSRLSFVFLLAAAPALAQPEPSPTPTPAPEPAPVAEPAPAPASPSVVAAPAVASLTEKAEPKQATVPLEIKPGGYLQADTRAFATDTGTHEQTLRRLRFKVDGKAFRHFKFKTLIETAQSRLQVLDAWIEFAPRPEIGLRFGKDKGQFGIERLQSATELTFVERAYPTQLAPNRDIGLALRGDVGPVHYSAAIVNGVADNAVLEGETDDEYEYNVHVLVSPFKQRAAYGDLGIGGAATFGRTQGTLLNPGVTAIKSAGQATIFKYATTDTLATTAVTDGYRHRLAAHAYYYAGPVGALAEYVSDYEPVLLAGSHTLLHHRAWQLATSVAVTPGDKPTYKSIVPKRPFDLDAGTWGAVEVAVRYSELRIDDDAFMAGIASETASIARARAGTLGVNWYFNKYIKLQLDYEGTKFEGGAATGDRPTEHLITTRFQAAI
jgi:phosphate-selective porin OprO/OprP